MATCDIDALTADAVANRFAGLSWRDLRAVELQLWYSLSGSTQTIAQLRASACANGLGCVRGRALLATKAQMLCNLTDGLIDCVNLIPVGSLYSDNDGISYNNAAGWLYIVPIVVAGEYNITWGANEQGIAINPTNTAILSTGVGTTTTFTVLQSTSSVFLISNPNASGLPVTAIICKV